MKESNCHDPKMKAYCNAVRCIEDKFDGLELNHIARKYNEEADELAKIASGRTTVPPNIFARDIAKPSVDFKDPAGVAERPLSAQSRTHRRGNPRPWRQRPRSPRRMRLK